MSKLTIQGIVLVLMIAALPLTSVATTTDSGWLVAVGLGVFGLAALTPPVLRYVGPDGDEDDDDENGDENGKDDR